MHLGAGDTYAAAALSLPMFEDSPCCDGSASISPTFATTSPQEAGTGHCSHIPLSEDSRTAQGRAAPAHTSQSHSHSSAAGLTGTEQPASSRSRLTLS